MRKQFLYIFYLLGIVMVLSCSTTSSLDYDEQLYTGMKPIKYNDYTPSPHFYDTQAEIEAALACAPNGALFGSSYYRTPFPIGLWVWNAFHNSKGVIGKWLTSSLGNRPVLLSDASPELRTSVAESVLQNNGYFHGKVSYSVVESKPTVTKTDSVLRPRKAKIAYEVDPGPLYTLDSISYVGFSDDELKLINLDESLLKTGNPFDISVLDAERDRIYTQLREHGYYFYQKEYTTYMADTVKVPHRVQLQLHKLDSLPEESTRKWVIGRTVFRVRRNATEQLTDTVSRRFLTVNYGGKRPALRPRVVLQDMRLKPGDLFSQSELEESSKRLTGKGVFSAVDISFSPRRLLDGNLMVLNDTVRQTTRKGEDRSGSSVLDMTIDCTLDKPYDASLEANFTQKTSGRGGPGVGLTFGRRNVFRGAENLTFNLSASADFPISAKGGDHAANYDILGDVTLEVPRMLMPKFIKPNRKWYQLPNTLLRVSAQTLNRTGFYRRNIFSAELTYSFRPKETVRHTFTPLAVDYSYIASHSEKFDSIAQRSWYNLALLDDNFVPKMRYSYTYSSSLRYLNPIAFSLSITEAGNIINGCMAIGGNHWDKKDKKLFGVPMSQFLKIEADWRKTWSVGRYDKFLAHAYFGYVKSYGNSTFAPMSEMFFMGGANDLRGFSTRSIGPGNLHIDDRDLQYVLALGDMKMLANLEYRKRLFGSLYGALFVDMGNCWVMNDVNGNTEEDARLRFSLKNLGRDIAVDAGIGIRYDLDFFVLRLDWGFVIHAPYDTQTSSYFNTPRFSQAQCLNFAIGYPF